MEKEICICAAVKAGNKIWRGHRHGHAMQAMRDEMSWKMTGEQLYDFYIGDNKMSQGFITSENRYVEREEGRKLQDAAGIKSADKNGYRANTLFSEDLYPENN
jgi:hypothetical protein